MAFNTTDATLGANLNVTSTTQQFPLGERATGSSNTQWVYCKAASIITQFDFVTIDTSFNVNSMTAANVKAGQQIGTAQVAFASADYGWICVSGSGLLLNVQASTQTSVPVIPGPTTGRVDTTAGVAAGVTSILGVQLVLTAGLTATAIAGSLSNPVLKL
jgi:hypothetical protein